MAIIITRHLLAVTTGILGNIVSFLVFLAPVPTFYRIYKKKSTESFQSLPYQVALFSSMLWLYYALLKHSGLLLITINVFGCVVETVYVSVYIAYAIRDKKISTIKLLIGMNVVLFSIIFTSTRFLVKSEPTRIAVLGWICVAVSVSVFAAPLGISAHVVRTKSAEFMPFTLSFFLTLSAVIWFAYGLFLSDLFLVIPNVVGFVLGTVQMILYAIYRNGENPKEEKKKLPDRLKTIAVVNALDASEGYPIEMASESDAGIKEDTKEQTHNNESHETLIIA